MYTGSPTCIWFITLAWLACIVYFLILAFRTHHIQRRESNRTRTWDTLLLWGGYLVLFWEPRGPSVYNRVFIESSWSHAACDLGTVLAIAGLSYTLWARAALGRYWSRTVAIKVNHKLITFGPYRYVRHPLYLGLMVATGGTALAFGLWRVLLGLAMLWTGFIYRAYREDAFMAQQFGAEFEAYRARSGRLLPRRAAG